MKPQRINSLADELYVALRSRRTVAPLTAREPSITIVDAYGISARLLARRQADGERVIGEKIGVTSKAMQDMLGVHQPDFGFLSDRMQFANGAAISLSEAGLIQPRAEGEIAFILKKDLCGPGVTREDVLHATEAVLPCFEIVDSRIADWRIRIEDTVADNASCGVFVLGDRTHWSQWLEPMGGKRVPTRTRLGGAGFKPIEPAPGRYVKVRSESLATIVPA